MPYAYNSLTAWPQPTDLEMDAAVLRMAMPVPANEGHAPTRRWTGSSDCRWCMTTSSYGFGAGERCPGAPLRNALALLLFGWMSAG